MVSLRDLITNIPPLLTGEDTRSLPSPSMGEGEGGGDSPLSTTHVDPAIHLEEAASILSPDEREQAMRLHRTTDRQSYIFAHAVLRLLLSSRLETDPGSIRFEIGKHGKPALLFPRRDIHFNLSHADNAIAIALAASPIGIDVDAVRDDLDLDGIGQRFFTSDELDYLNCASPGEKRKRFFYIWTRKEALAKAAGTGVDTITSVSVLRDCVRMADESGFMREYSVQTLSPPSGYSLALALQTLT